MRYFVITVLLCAAALSSCASAGDGSGTNPNAFSYDPSAFSTFYVQTEVDEVLFAETFEERELKMRALRGFEYNENAFILVVEVAGESINRIIFPEDETDRDPTIVYGNNHVITPVRIKDVIYQSTGNKLQKDDVIHVMERYFIATEETPVILREVGSNAVVTTDYDPMERGKTYVIYAGNDIWNEDSPYLFNGEPPYVVDKNGVYCISHEPATDNLRNNDIYMRIWKDVIEAYGDRSIRS
jgi:hypothetical protein